MKKILKQFEEMKSKHPSAMLIFSEGDTYKMFSIDALEASKILNLPLDNICGGSVMVLSFPAHKLQDYIYSLVMRAGKRVAICDQLKDPRLTKKLVKRSDYATKRD